jgi:hypothetical protein
MQKGVIFTSKLIEIFIKVPAGIKTDIFFKSKISICFALTKYLDGNASVAIVGNKS